VLTRKVYQRKLPLSNRRPHAASTGTRSGNRLVHSKEIRHLRAFVPEYLEIDFANIKSPRLYYPRYKGTIVVQFPEANLSPKQKGVIRSQKLLEFAALVKINEVTVGEQFAMRMKLLEPEKSKRRFKATAHKSGEEPQG
jgi:hypothetical protein